MTNADERSHLLTPSRDPSPTSDPTNNQRSSSADLSSPAINSESGEAGTHATMSRHEFNAVFIYIGLATILEIATFLTNVPMSQVLEDAICDTFRMHRHTPGNGRGPVDCGNDDAVQRELAVIRGVLGSLDLIPGLLCALPYGQMADKKGHRVVIRLSLLGITLKDAFKLSVYRSAGAVSPRLVWLSPLFELIGGGPTVLSALVFASLTDTLSEHHRSTVFSYLVGSSMAVRIVMALLAAVLMEHSPWLPVSLGFACSGLTLVYSLLLQEQAKPASLPNLTPREDRTTNQYALRQQWETVKSILYDLTMLNSNQNRNSTLLLLTLLTTTLGWHAQDVLAQLAHKKYGLAWSISGYLSSLNGFVTMILLLCVLPCANHFLVDRLGYSIEHRDLMLTRASALLMGAGTLIIGLSVNSSMLIAGTVIESLGGGYNLIIRSLIVSLAPNVTTGTLFNFVSLLETGGSLVAGPLLAFSFNMAIQLGTEWLGLPFLLAFGLVGIAVVLLWAVRLP